jgi:uncharacterized protein
MTVRTLVHFSSAQSPPAYDHPRPERLVSAHNPLRTTWKHYEADGVSAGVWTCEPGAWRIAFVDGTDEFFHVLAGRIRITGDDGSCGEFGPGEACIIPGGFTGLFEVLEAVRKHYVFIARSGA